MKLAEQLDHYTTEALAGMLAAWGAGEKVTKKADRLVIATRLLADPETFRRAPWEPAERVLLALFARAETPVAGVVLGAARMRGEPGVDRAFERLVASGCLLATWTPYGSKLDADAVIGEPTLPLALAPGLAALPPLPLPAPPALSYAPVPDAQVREVRPNRGGETAARLTAVVACAARVRLKVNKDGSLSAGAIATVRKELGVETGEVAWLIALAAAAELLSVQDGRLEPSGTAEPGLGALLARVRRGFERRGGWLDDIDVSDPKPPELGGTTPESALLARALVYGTLARIRTDGWVRLDAIVDTLVALDPLVGYRGDRYRPWDRPRTDSPSRKQRQVDYVRGAIVQAAWRLGIVDLGTTGAWYAPERISSDYRYDERFRGGIGYLRAADAKLPEWSRTPCDLVVRIPPLGRRVLGLTDEEPPVEAVPGFHVGMDYEVVAPIATTPAALLYALDRVGLALPAAPADPVRRWKLERERWLAALQGGLDGAALLTTLATAQGRPLPANLTDTIAGWSEGYGTLTLWTRHDLVEYPDRAARDAAAVAGGTAIGDRFLLVRQGLAPGTLLDYGGPPTRVLDVGPDGALTLHATPDLLVADEVSAVASGEGRTLRLDPAKLRGRPAAATLAWLRARARAPLTEGTAIAVRGWCGDVPAQLAVVDLLQLRDASDAAALLEHRELAQHVAGVLYGGLIVLKPGARGPVLAALAALGITPETKLRYAGEER